MNRRNLNTAGRQKSGTDDGSAAGSTGFSWLLATAWIDTSSGRRLRKGPTVLSAEGRPVVVNCADLHASQVRPADTEPVHSPPCSLVAGGCPRSGTRGGQPLLALCLSCLEPHRPAPAPRTASTAPCTSSRQHLAPARASALHRPATAPCTDERQHPALASVSAFRTGRVTCIQTTLDNHAVSSWHITASSHAT